MLGVTREGMPTFIQRQVGPFLGCPSRTAFVSVVTREGMPTFDLLLQTQIDRKQQLVARMLANIRRYPLIPGFRQGPFLSVPHGLDLCLGLSQNGQTERCAYSRFIVANTDLYET